MGGFVKSCARARECRAGRHRVAARLEEGLGSGWITKEAFEHFTEKMIADLKAQGPFDGAYLSLHGAMGVRDVAKPEATLARRVREVIGPKGFIAGTFDPHGNEDDEFLRYANLALCIKYYPHYDGALCKASAPLARLIRCIRGDYKPTTATAKPPIIYAVGAAVDRPVAVDGSGSARAGLGSARDRRSMWSFYYGFAFMDAADAGMTLPGA